MREAASTPHRSIESGSQRLSAECFWDEEEAAGLTVPAGETAGSRAGCAAGAGVSPTTSRPRSPAVPACSSATPLKYHVTRAAVERAPSAKRVRQTPAVDEDLDAADAAELPCRLSDLPFDARRVAHARDVHVAPDADGRHARAQLDALHAQVLAEPVVA